MLSECSTLFRTFSSSIQIVLETYRYFQIPADSSKFFQIFLDSSRFSQVLTDSFRISQFLSDAIRFFQILSYSFRFLQILFKPPNFSQIPSNFTRFFYFLLILSFRFFRFFSGSFKDTVRDRHDSFKFLSSVQVVLKPYRYSLRFPQIPPDSFKCFQILSISFWFSVSGFFDFFYSFRWFRIASNSLKFFKIQRHCQESSRFFKIFRCYTDRFRAFQVPTDSFSFFPSDFSRGCERISKNRTKSGKVCRNLKGFVRIWNNLNRSEKF